MKNNNLIPGNLYRISYVNPENRQRSKPILFPLGVNEQYKWFFIEMNETIMFLFKGNCEGMPKEYNAFYVLYKNKIYTVDIETVFEEIL